MVGRYHINPNSAVMPIALWPEEDRALWLQALELDDPFLEFGKRAHLRSISNHKVEKGYGRYLTCLKRHEPEALKDRACERINRNRVKRFVMDMEAEGNRKMTLLARLQELHSIAVILDPGNSFQFIKDFEARIRHRTETSRHEGRSFTATDELLSLGLKLMQNAGQQTTNRLKAIDYRDGLLIALLAVRPMRRKNFAALKLDKNVVQLDGVWRIRLSPEETKTHNRIDVEWPSELVEPLETYLAVHRPILMAIVGRWHKPIDDALWVSSNGSPLTEMAFYQQVTKRTAEAFGKPVNPHAFRHSAASTLACEDPAHVRISATILGHSRFQTTEQYYIMAQQAQAHDAFVKLMLAVRKQARDQRASDQPCTAQDRKRS
jgi:site-specific recombinase XerD